VPGSLEGVNTVVICEQQDDVRTVVGKQKSALPRNLFDGCRRLEGIGFAFDLFKNSEAAGYKLTVENE
jgi:hypothetical protein